MSDPFARWQTALDVERAGRLGRAIVFRHGTEFARQLGTFWVALDPDDVGYSPLARSHGYWESGITCWMAKQIIREDMFCVDVGANHGYYTFLLAALGAKVVAVEPQARLFDLLSNAREMNGSKHEVRLLNAAAANRAGEMSLFVPIGHGMDATISANWRPAAAFGSRQESVKVIALDEELDGQTPDFIKIDAEGAEPEVWDGMTRTWNRARPATLLEFNPARYAEPAGFARRLFSEAAVSFVDVLGYESRLPCWEELTDTPGKEWMLVLR